MAATPVSKANALGSPFLRVPAAFGIIVAGFYAPHLLYLLLRVWSPHVKEMELVGIVGTAYQLVAVFIILCGINAKLKHFGLPGVWADFKGLLGFRGQPAVVAVLSASLGAARASMRGVNETNISGKPIDERIEHVWKAVLAAQKRLGKAEDACAERKDEVLRAIKASEAKLSSKISRERADLRDLTTKDFKREIVGVLVLAVGVVFGTVPWLMTDIYNRHPWQTLTSQAK